MSKRVTTYDPRQVLISLGIHSVSGLADDSFISIEPKGEGITSKSGCDGEVARAISPDRTYTVKITVLQNSRTNSYLQNMFNKDQDNGEGMFSILVKDLRGGMMFSADNAWITKNPSRSFGKDTNNREWTIETGPAEIKE